MSEPLLKRRKRIDPSLSLIQMRQSLPEEEWQIFVGHGERGRHTRKLLAVNRKQRRRHAKNVNSCTAVIREPGEAGTRESAI